MVISIKRLDKEIDITKLNPKEVARIKEYGSETRRLESYTSLYMLHSMLKDKGINDFNIKYHFSGKPYLEGLDWKYNMSHSNDFAAVVLCSEEVGIDIEKITPRIRKISQRFLSEKQKEKFLKDEMTLLELTTLWTIKEAFTKLIGRGLTAPFNEIEVGAEDGISIATYKGEKGFIKSFLYDEYVVSVCVKNKESLLNIQPQIEIISN